MQALKLIFVTNMLDTTLAELLLFYYTHGDSVLQQLITNYLLRKGLNDPFAYFPTVIEDNLSAAPLVSAYVEEVGMHINIAVVCRMGLACSPHAKIGFKNG